MGLCSALSAAHGAGGVQVPVPELPPSSQHVALEHRRAEISGGFDSHLRGLRSSHRAQPRKAQRWWLIWKRKGKGGLLGAGCQGKEMG